MRLFDHQIEDAQRMASGDDLPNFSEAGTGKTHTTLEAVRLAKFNSGLIVAPTIALPMWKAEVEKYLGASAKILKTGKSPVRGDADFYITSFGLASNVELRSKLMSLGSDRGGVMVIDESHYLKNPIAARTKAIFGPVTTGRNGLFEYHDQTWELTGTPIVKHYDDIWSQLRATQPQVLRDYGVLEYDDFVRKFCVMQVKKYHPRMSPQRVVVASQNGHVLNEMLYSPVQGIGAIRRKMADVGASMPPLTYRDVFVPIKRSAELKSLISDIDFDNFMGDSDDLVMTKARRLLGELKLEGCVDYVLELAGPTLVGYWYTDTGDALVDRLQKCGLTVARVQGSTSMKVREEIRVAFNAGKIDVLVGQMAAMNVSWNLQECGNHVVILDDDFSPAVIEQFVKRVWRFGQENHVQVDFIKAEHVLDEAITRVRTNKEAKADVAIG